MFNGDFNYDELFAIGGISLFVLLFIFIFVILALVMTFYFIGQWKMFRKANEEGWKAIVPVYNIITLSKLVGVNPWWLLVIGIFYLCEMVPFINLIAWLPFMFTYYYFFIILGIATARSYGKSDAWAVGFILMPWLFYFLLGCSNSNYCGVTTIKDPVWDWFVKTFGVKQYTPTVSVTEDKNKKYKYCTKCGIKIEDDSKFCTNCGEKVK